MINRENADGVVLSRDGDGMLCQTRRRRCRKKGGGDGRRQLDGFGEPLLENDHAERGKLGNFQEEKFGALPVWFVLEQDDEAWDEKT